MEKAVKHPVLNNSRYIRFCIYSLIKMSFSAMHLSKNTQKKETYFMKKKNNTYHAMEMNALWRRLIEAKYSSDAA